MLMLSLLFCGCTVLKNVEIVTPDYIVALDKVELPANSKEQFGERITKEVLNDTMRYVFEDEFFKVYWYVGVDRFYFTLYNKSLYPIKIVWDDVAFVNMDKSVSKMIHSGVSYSQRNESQVPVTIPRDAWLEDILIPVQSIVNGKEWSIMPFFDEHLNGWDAVERAEKYKGETMSILFPVKIEDVQNDYTFVFKVNDVVPRNTTMVVHDEKAEETRMLIAFGLGLLGTFTIFILPFLER